MSRSPTLIEKPLLPIRRRLVESLYVEAMVLADEAYGCFAHERQASDAPFDPLVRIGLACESLKTTTRIMHVIAWLLHQRAVFAGEISANSTAEAGRLGYAIPADAAICATLSPAAQAVIASSERLFERIAALENARGGTAGETPVHLLMAELSARL